MKKIFIILLVIVSLPNMFCRKFLEIPPPEFVAENNAYSTDETSIAVLNGLYIEMSRAGGIFTGNGSISVLGGLSSDEFNLFSGSTDPKLISYYTNSLSVSPDFGSETWTPLYTYIGRANAAIEGISASNSITEAVKKQLLGEAYFLRAFYYFYLTNLYGDVPLILTTDYKSAAIASKSNASDVYLQIIKDLNEAKTLLSKQYLNQFIRPYSSTPEKVRPTYWAASSLLSRAYLYIGDYQNAVNISSEVIGANLFTLPALNNVYLKNSSEAIWQLQPTTQFYNTEDARFFIILQSGLNNTNPLTIRGTLLNSFESGDLRAIEGNWLNSITIQGTKHYFPFKYKINTQNINLTTAAGLTEYLMVFRLAEQYLIRAEAKAKQGNLSDAISDLDKIRQRAGLGLLAITNPGINQTALLDTIVHERQVELFSEWGHRWLDLKRTGNIDAVMSIVTPLKSGGVSWKPYQKLYPIPSRDLEYGVNVTQNSGY